MSAEPKQKMTLEQYLAFERASETRHEYLNGEIYAMVGATEKHNTISVSLVLSLGPQVRKQGCRLYTNDMRLKVSATGLYTYPDITVVCGDRKFDDKYKDTLLNPTLIIEVLSPSTENYDRGEKFRHYRALPSLQTYVLVYQDSPRIEQYVRRKVDMWEYKETIGLDAEAELESINCIMSLMQVYEDIEFDNTEPESGVV
jgi:Uma2 family endonuclease